MILNQKNNTILIIIFFIILLSIISTLIIEHVLDHQPCNLCLYERIPYFVSALLLIYIFLFKKYERITFLILFLIFTLSFLLAFYHFGIEQGFFSESFVCNVENQQNILSKEQLLKELNQNVVSCKDVTFRIFGFSLTTFNIIVSLFLLILLTKIFKNYEKFKS